ncbi:MAG TPA: GxxExxY protein [Pyrinomonadaceae bacterium]|nr:GxxExxY protein [Pyrinomonadaceae bacterium]
MDKDDKSRLLKSLFESDDSMNEINKITEIIIGSAYKIANTLGCGFLEKVYENALAYEIRKHNLEVKQQESIKVYYEGFEVGFYEADLWIENKVLVELKAVKNLDEVHRAQCLNYLKATKVKICLLINFGNPKVEIKRIAL